MAGFSFEEHGRSDITSSQILVTSVWLIPPRGARYKTMSWRENLLPVAIALL
ncbi:MAG: hypothetical protein GXY14_03490 [Spirochaetes bacterium]|nr:hypothetical protein [Spirochaetota bacterium]